MTRTVLITGATGFVGRQVLRKLADCSVEIRAVIREGSQDKLMNGDSLEKVITTPDLFADSADWWANVCDGVVFARGAFLLVRLILGPELRILAKHGMR